MSCLFSGYTDVLNRSISASKSYCGGLLVSIYPPTQVYGVDSLCVRISGFSRSFSTNSIGVGICQVFRVPGALFSETLSQNLFGGVF